MGGLVDTSPTGTYDAQLWTLRASRRLRGPAASGSQHH